MWEYKDTPSSEELYHYGVIGMKWGVRRAAKQNRSVRNAKAIADSDYREYSRAYDKATGTLFGKNRRAAANKRLTETAEQARKSQSDYKKAYKKAKTEAAASIHKQGYDRKTAQRVAKMSTGKAIGQSMLLGSYGALKYNYARAHGQTKGKAVASAILSNWANNMTLGALGRFEQKNRRKQYN